MQHLSGTSGLLGDGIGCKRHIRSTDRLGGVKWNGKMSIGSSRDAPSHAHLRQLQSRYQMTERGHLDFVKGDKNNNNLLLVVAICYYYPNVRRATKHCAAGVFQLNLVLYLLDICALRLRKHPFIRITTDCVSTKWLYLHQKAMLLLALSHSTFQIWCGAHHLDLACAGDGRVCKAV